MVNMLRLQIGKKGLTEEFLTTLKTAFVKTESIRIGLLPSSTRDRAEVKTWADKISQFLGKNFTIKIIGYTIVVRKWRKAR
jgi:RNA-binding protein YhbY